MANDFASGVISGEEQKKSNPFNIIFGRFQEAQARRYKEDAERKKEEFELSKALQVLNKDYLYKQELQKAQAEEERKTKMVEGEAEATRTQKLIESFNGKGGNLPPGTTAKIGNLTIPVNREFTEGESKTLSQAGSLITQIGELRSTLQNEIDAKKAGKSTTNVKLKGLFPFAAGSKEAQQYKLTLKDAADRILRLRSGAQINEREYKRLSNLLPTFGRYNEVDIKQLDKFTEEFSAIQGRIESGAKWDGKRGQFTVGVKQQTNNPEYQKYLQSIGQ